MDNELIDEKGKLAGTRINVYDMVNYFLDPSITESYICRMYSVSPEQVAACRAFVFQNLDQVLSRHLEIEARNARGNSPDVKAQFEKASGTIVKFKSWLEERKKAGDFGPIETPADPSTASPSSAFPSFREWLAQQEARPAQGP